MIDYVQFFPTLRCNRKCQFCFSRDLVFDEFPQSKIRAFAELLEQNRIKSLDILGGEPLLYDHLETLIEEVLEKGIEITISSNGTMVDKIENLIKKFDNQKLKIGISLDEPPSEFLKNLIERHKIWIKSVLRRDRMPDRATLEFAKNREIKYYLIYMDALSERDLENSLSFPEFIEKVNFFKKFYQKLEPVYCKGFIGGTKNYRCPAGTEKISIMPDGSVYPCYLLANQRDYCLGNIFFQYLDEILNESKLEKFRFFSGNLCDNKECDFFLNCKGGCIALSIIHYGTPDVGDPRCVTKREA